MFVGEEHTVEPFGSDVALLEPDNDLPRAQSAIDQDPAVVGRNESAVAGAAAAEHGKAEHEERLAKRDRVHKRNCSGERFSVMRSGGDGKATALEFRESLFATTTSGLA